MVRQAHLIAVVGTFFLIGCAVLLAVGCAGTSSEAPQEKQGQAEITKQEQENSFEATASEEIRCEGTRTIEMLKGKGSIVDSSVQPGDPETIYVTNDIPGCPDKGGVLSGTDKLDRLAGEDSEDEVRGLGGSDQLYGGLGSDVLYGSTGNDELIGGGWNPSLDPSYTDRSKDVLYGGPGRDILDGAVADDVLYGGDGDDNIHLGSAGWAEAWSEARARMSSTAGMETIFLTVGLAPSPITSETSSIAGQARTNTLLIRTTSWTAVAR